MKEYEVKVIEEKIVYVEADTEGEAIELAKTEAIHEEPELITCHIISAIDIDDIDVTICGAHGCDGCLYQHSNNIKICGQMAEKIK